MTTPFFEPGFIRKAAPEVRKARGVLLHHSWEKIKMIGKLLDRGSQRRFLSDDYPLIVGKYKRKRIALVCTRMGVDETLNIVDELACIGVRVFVKIGTFVALEENIPLGDIRIPTAAQSLPGTLNAILPRGRRQPRASKSLVGHISNAATKTGICFKQGVVLTNPVYGPFIRNQVKDPAFGMNFWRGKCFGKEWECSALFAAAKSHRVHSAAILVCNRRWETLKTGRGWREHTRSAKYRKAYRQAIELTLNALIEFDHRNVPRQ